MTSLVQERLFALYAVQDRMLLHLRRPHACSATQATSLLPMVQQHCALCAVTPKHQTQRQGPVLAQIAPQGGTQTTLALPIPVLLVVLDSIPHLPWQPVKRRASIAMQVLIKVFGAYQHVFRVRLADIQREGVLTRATYVHEASFHRQMRQYVPCVGVDLTCQVLVPQSVIFAQLGRIRQGLA
jgi:hypothetical protein